MAQSETQSTDRPAGALHDAMSGHVASDKLPPIFGNLGQAPRDDAVYAAWQRHMISGFSQNNEMFRKTLTAFIWPYWLTVGFYAALVVVGIGSFVAAAVLGARQGISSAALFGGLSVLAFLGFFITKPLRALERNVQFITWLGIVYNTYWTRLMYATDPDTVQEDLEAIKTAAVRDLTVLLEVQQRPSNLRVEQQSGSAA